MDAARDKRLAEAIDRMTNAIVALADELVETDRLRERIQAECDRLANLETEELIHAYR